MSTEKFFFLHFLNEIVKGKLNLMSSLETFSNTFSTLQVSLQINIYILLSLSLSLFISFSSPQTSSH